VPTMTDYVTYEYVSEDTMFGISRFSIFLDRTVSQKISIFK